MQKSIIFIALAISITFFILSQSDFLSQDSKSKLLQNESLSQQTVENEATDLFQSITNNNLAPIDFLNDIVQNIAKDSSIYDLVGFAIGMVVYAIFVFHFYRFLSKRDMFSINLEQRMTHVKFKSSGEKVSTAPRVVAFIATNFFIFPFVIFLWFLGYSSFMFLLVQQLPTATIFLVTSSLIIAIRISAYYNEDLAKDLAKLLPFALLGIFLFNPQFYSVDDILKRLEEIPSFITLIASFLVVAMAVEIVLSTTYLIKIRFFHKEKVKNVDDSEHPI